MLTMKKVRELKEWFKDGMSADECNLYTDSEVLDPYILSLLTTIESMQEALNDIDTWTPHPVKFTGGSIVAINIEKESYNTWKKKVKKALLPEGGDDE